MLAHELAHVRSRDVLVQTSAVLLAVLLVDFSRLGGWFERALLAVLGPVAAAFVHLLLSPKRELAADRVAAGLCGSADGLVEALVRLDRASDLVSFHASPATEPLYTVNPFAEEGLAALFVTHPPLERRLGGATRASPGSSDHIVTSRRSPRCSIHDAQHALPREAALLGDALRRDVAGERPELHPRQVELVERPGAEQPHRPGDVAAAPVARAPPSSRAHRSGRGARA